MPFKPFPIAQNSGDVGMARAGGAKSAASTPIAPDKGSGWAGMEATLLKGPSQDIKQASRLAPNPKAGRQSATLASGGDLKNAVKSPKAFSVRSKKSLWGGSPEEGESKPPKLGKARLFSSDEKQ